jgi:putative ATP-dependent endonuclease of the OLD family
MYVCLLEISGFRGIQSGRIVFEPHSVLLGTNNVGKSAVIDALGLVLGRDRLVRTLGDYDFFGGLPNASSRIKIVATLTGFEPDDPDEHLHWLHSRDGGVPFWWDGENVHASERPAGATLCTQIAFVARFDTDDLEVKTIRYFLDGDGDPFEHSEVTTVKDSHLKEIGFFLLPSNRTWDRVVSFGSELFKRVLRFQSAIPSESVTKLRESLRDPVAKLEEDKELIDFVGRINNEISGFIGPRSSGLRFRPTSGDIEGVLQALTPHLSGKGNSVQPLSKHGSGVISLQTLLLLFEFGRARHLENQNFILAAEEPELHLHPGHHRRLVARIRGTSNQSITTTHSPEIAAYYRPQEVLILQNRDGQLDARPLIPRGHTIPDANALMRLYTLYRAAICEALMHNVVLLPEGITEYQWVRALTRMTLTAEGWTQPDNVDDSHAVGVIPTQDSHVVKTFERLRPMIDRLIPLVDGDSAGDEYVKQLRKLQDPPAIIVQLSPNATLETLVAHIVLPSTNEEWVQLEEIMPGLPIHDLRCVHEELTENKQNWKMHEAIIDFISRCPARTQRASYQLRMLSEVATTGKCNAGTWSLDEKKSDGRTQVWRWKLP